MPANLENSAVATGLEKVSFHSNPKEKKNAKRQNGLSDEALQIAETRREAKGKGEREKFQRIASGDKKAFFLTMQRNRGKQ